MHEIDEQIHRDNTDNARSSTIFIALLAGILVLLIGAAGGILAGYTIAAEQYATQVQQLSADIASCGQGWYDTLAALQDALVMLDAQAVR